MACFKTGNRRRRNASTIIRIRLKKECDELKKHTQTFIEAGDPAVLYLHHTSDRTITSIHLIRQATCQLAQKCQVLRSDSRAPNTSCRNQV